MKILIEMPTWLGDSVMATPAIENLLKHFTMSEITLIGSQVSIEVLKNHPKVVNSYVIEKKLINLYKFVSSLEEFDVFLSFRSSLRSKFMQFFVKSEKTFQFDKNKYSKGHQVEKYNNFINDCFDINLLASKLKLQTTSKKETTRNRLLGINPGASYGNSKRWHPKKFADVAIDLSNQFDVIILGGPSEKDIAKDIESCLVENGIKNYTNFSAKTSITELIGLISNLDLFITGDSGPMHIAAAFQIPTVSIFGPTNENETSQWLNEKSVIVKKNLECQPCMKRSCPLVHHNCMKLIESDDVLKAVTELF